MSGLKFDKQELTNLEYSLDREVLATDRRGGYMSTTIVGCNTRKYHGLMVAPIDASDRTYVLLSSLDETIMYEEQPFNLAIHRFPNNYEPRGHKYIVDSLKNGGENTVTARGVCYGKEPNPTISGDTTMDGQGVGSYTSNIRGLEPNTLYYVRAYATNARGTAYGSEHDFTTTEATGGRTPSGYINGRGYVDLGLSVKWASCNVGATLPEEYGGYFSWGETEEKDFYGWSAYKLCNGTINTLTKYCYDEMEGNVDNKMVLEPIDDVANVVMGEGWRMPTDAEIMELVEGCTWEWTVLNDVNGYRVTGTNGNSIFLPAAGYISGKEVEYPGVYGMYWSSTIGDLFTYHGCCLEFTSQYFVNMVTYRNGGQTVRAVFE